MKRASVVPMLVLVLASGCVPSHTLRAPTTAVIARLESSHRSRPSDGEAARALGIAYYQAARYEDARAALATAQDLLPGDGTVALYTGMTAERLGDPATARAAYSSYIEHGRTRRVRRELQDRLVALARLELRASMRAAIAREEELAVIPPRVDVVAVLPFRFTGADSSLLPLERGLADLVVTDLARIRSLTIVERSQMQTLLDEIALSESGRTSDDAAVRSGRLLQAGSIVQGAITQLPGEGGIRLDGAVIDVSTAETRPTDGAADAADALFTLQKRFTYAVIEALGVRPTAEERALIDARPTRSLAAFLSYSAGLMAEDDGRLDEADRRFGEALRIDPGFGAARDRQAGTQAAMSAAASSTASIERSLQGTSEGRIAAAATQGTTRPASDAVGGTLSGIVDDLNPSIAGEATRGSTPVSGRDPASATTGTEQISTGSGTVIIIIRQPTP